MTREKILAMGSGREMDALVAEKVMGLTVICQQESDHFLHGLAKVLHVPKRERITIPMVQMWRTSDGKVLRRYSTDIAAAWTVVEYMRAEGWDFELVTRIWGRIGWRATLYSCRVAWSAYGSTAPEAICRAALVAALGGEKDADNR